MEQPEILENSVKIRMKVNFKKDWQNIREDLPQNSAIKTLSPFIDASADVIRIHVKIIIIISRLYFGYTNLESIKILGVDPAKRFLLFLNYCDSNISLFSRN